MKKKRKTRKGKNNPFYGKKHTKESLNRISESHKKENLSEETLRKMSAAQKGKKVSKETKNKLSKLHKGQIPWNKGKKLSEEHKRKMGVALKGNIPWNKGIATSNKIKKKISNILKGRIFSQEHRKKISESKKGVKRPPLSTKWKIKISKSLIGRKYTEKQKRTMSAAQQGIKIKDWKEYISFKPYDQNFNRQFKKLIRKRDNNICMVCRISREKLHKSLHIHHLDYNKLNSIPKNCISLCNSCHAKTNINREEWLIFFQSLLNKRYKYHYEN